MPGFSNISSDESIMFADNVSFDGTQRGGKITADGQLLIGSTASPHIKPGYLASSNSTISVTNSSGAIDVATNPSYLVPWPPNKYVTLVDDFYSITNAYGQLDWSVANTTRFAGTATNPGILSFGNAASCYVYLGSAFSTFDVVVGGGEISVNYVVNLGTLSDGTNRYIMYCGIGNFGGSAPTDGIWFEYSDDVNSGNWLCVSSSSSSTTTSDSSVAGNTNFVNLGFVVNAAGTSISFTINGVSVGSAITTNIPSIATSPFVYISRSSGTKPTQYLDLFYMRQDLTTGR